MTVLGSQPSFRLGKFARFLVCAMALFVQPPSASAGDATLKVSVGGDLQAALDAAKPGDTIELEAGATFTGNFLLPNKKGSGWIYIRSSAANQLPMNVRVKPDQARLMPKIVTPNTIPAIRTAAGAHHYHFIGIEITTKHAPGATNRNLVYLEAPDTQDSLSEVPTDIVFERCYIHGTPDRSVRRGIALNSARTDIMDSYFSDFHEVGADSQAIAGWNGPGPFRIINNYLEGAGENLMFGGADPEIANLVPSDIEIRHNHFFKPLSWKIGHSSYAGKPWAVKNLLELKNARRVTITGNILEHNWAHAQNGFAILFTVRNQDGGAPWSVIEDVVFALNIVRHTGAAVNILGRDDNYESGQLKRITIRDNLFDHVGDGKWGGSGALFQMLSGSADVVIEHNTALQTRNVITADGAPHTGFIYRNNITPHNTYGVFGSGSSSGTPSLNAYFPDATFLKNILAGGEASRYPSNNFFPSSMRDVGFGNMAGGNYRLASSSRYKNAGTDGKDPGVNFEELEKATVGVIRGILKS
jgi:hypothetical protein